MKALVLQEWQRQPTLAEAAGLRSQLAPETEPAAAPWAAVQQSTGKAAASYRTSLLLLLSISRHNVKHTDRMLPEEL